MIICIEMKKYVYILMMAFVLFCSCSEKHKAVGKLKDFAKELRNNSAEYSTAQWQEATKEFAEIRSELATYDYSDADMAEIGRLEGECTLYIIKGTNSKALDGIMQMSRDQLP